MAKTETKAADMESVAQKKDKAFQEYLDTNKISGFGKQYAGEKGEVVIYRSNLQVKDATIPFMILLDNSVYTLLQFQVAAGAVKPEKADMTAKNISRTNLKNQETEVEKRLRHQKGSFRI